MFFELKATCKGPHLLESKTLFPDKSWADNLVLGY